MTQLPPCGLYRTTAAIAGIPADRLVYFHNHGDPGPGIYLPESWAANRARFSSSGTTVPADFDPRSLRALPAEGFYRVTDAFYCCAKQCTRFEPDAFVQLGYNGAGRALVFVPELARGSIDIPERGTMIDDNVLANMKPLAVREAPKRDDEIALPRGIVIH
jgi:hypothetical protein